MCIVLFQQLHYLDAPAAARWALHGGAGGEALYTAGGTSDAWMVDYNAALATICFMLFLGESSDAALMGLLRHALLIVDPRFCRQGVAGDDVQERCRVQRAVAVQLRSRACSLVAAFLQQLQSGHHPNAGALWVHSLSSSNQGYLMCATGAVNAVSCPRNAKHMPSHQNTACRLDRSACRA